MEFTVSKSDLVRELNLSQGVVEKKTTIPILSNVLLNAQKGKLTLSATDMDLAVTDSVEATATKTGSVTAPAHTMYEIVRKLPDGSQVEIESGANSDLTIRAGRSPRFCAWAPRASARRNAPRRSPRRCSATRVAWSVST